MYRIVHGLLIFSDERSLYREEIDKLKAYIADLFTGDDSATDSEEEYNGHTTTGKSMNKYS